LRPDIILAAAGAAVSTNPFTSTRLPNETNCGGKVTSYTLVCWTYNLFFHPLRSFPGPLINRISRLPYCYELLAGTKPFSILYLHEKYGPVVRVAPDELAFADSSAWKDIMGHRPHGEEMSKWEKFYRPVPGMSDTDIIFSNREEHARLRRQLAHGFSEKSMRDQQPLISKYIDLLIQRLRENGNGGTKALNMTDWYNFATFDVIGDLAFGESFGCLSSSDYHPWVKANFQLAYVGTFLQAACHYPALQRLILSFVPESAKREREQHLEFTRAKLQRRMELEPGRPDLMEGLLKKKEEWNMSLDSLQQNSGLLIIAGSETTATLLCGVTYLLLTNPRSLELLAREVRTTFSREDQIDLVSVGQLPYMLACLDEALRMYPPVPLGLPRVVPPGGSTISGHFVPENVSAPPPCCQAFNSCSNSTQRPLSPSTSGPCTTTRHISESRFSTTQSGSSGTPDLRVTTRTLCSHSLPGLGTVSEESRLIYLHCFWRLRD